MFPRSSQHTITISISLFSRTRVNSFIIFYNFIIYRGFSFKLEVSIYKESKREYLDEITGYLSINVVVDLATYITLLIWISLLFQFILLVYSLLHIVSEYIDCCVLKEYTTYITCINYRRKMTRYVLFGCFEIWRILFIFNSNK